MWSLVVPMNDTMMYSLPTRTPPPPPKKRLIQLKLRTEVRSQESRSLRQTLPTAPRQFKAVFDINIYIAQ
jgi:hypothetical protein